MTPKWSYFHSLTTQKGNIKVIVCLKAKKKIYWATIQNLLHKTHYSKSPYFVHKSIFAPFLSQNHRNSLIRVTYFVQIRVGWILQISKIQGRFLSKNSKTTFWTKNWTFNIVQENIYTIFCWGFLFAKFCVDTNGKMMALSFFKKKPLGSLLQEERKRKMAQSALFCFLQQMINSR